MNFSINVLGTASALPTTNRFPSAQVVDFRGRLFLIDCGEGTQIQLRRSKISFLKIDHICISHSHGDHIFGIFGLLSTMGLLGRTNDLNIYAPSTFSPVIDFFLANFGDGLKFQIKLHVLSMDEPEVIFESKSLELYAFPLNHRVKAYGFLFKEKTPPYNVRKDAVSQYSFTLAEIATLKRGEDVVREGMIVRNSDVAYMPYDARSYAYCSDTAPFDKLSEWVKGVSVLYHESTFPEEMSEMAQATFHSTTLQAAKCARDAGAGRLIVGHFSSRYPDVRPFLKEIESVFSPAELAVDGLCVEIPLLRH